MSTLSSMVTTRRPSVEIKHAGGTPLRQMSAADRRNAPAPGLPHIVFDWDDTLVATTFIKNVLLPSLPLYRQDVAITEESEFYPALAKHAEIVELLLRSATKHARVSILTLGSPEWFVKSAAHYFPGCDMLALLDELDIQTCYANRDSELVVMMSTQKGLDPGHVAKVSAFSSCLKRFYGGTDQQWNVLSVGDSIIERDALKEVVQKYNQVSADGPGLALGKTLKLKDHPSLDELTTQVSGCHHYLEGIIKLPYKYDGVVDERGRVTGS